MSPRRALRVPKTPQNTPRTPLKGVENTPAHPLHYGTSETHPPHRDSSPKERDRAGLGFSFTFPHTFFFLFVTNIQFFKYRLVKLHLQKSATVRSAR